MNVKKLGLFAFVLLLVSSLVLFGCSNSETAGDTDQGTTDGEQAQEEEATESEQGSVDYPTRTIEIIAGGGPGGGTDVFARATAKELSDILGVNVNVVNQPGAGGGVAAQEVASRPADGYTLLPTNADTHINMASGKTANFLEDGTFTGLARIHSDTYTLLVDAGSEYEDIEALIEAAKESPGEITIGGTATQGMDELTVTRFEEAAGIDLNYVPYEGAEQMHSALLGGHVDILLEEVGPAIQLVEGGQAAFSVIFAEDRLEDFPDVPTTVEMGWDLTMGMDRGWIVHADTPDEIVQILQDALEEVAQREDYQAFAEQSFLHLKDGWMDSEEYNAFMESEIEVYKQLLEEMNE